MPWRSTKATKSCGRYRASADLQKCGLPDRKFLGDAWILVKLQRPPPEMRIFSPGARAWSSRDPRYPCLEASGTFTVVVIPWLPIGRPEPTLGWEFEADGDTSLDAYAAHARSWIEHGARIVGGCCGTTPAHIGRLRALLASLPDEPAA